MSAVNGAAFRTGKDLLRATEPFTREYPLTSWWHLISTTVFLVSALVAAALLPWWPLRVLASLLGALLMVRDFVLYHDYMHGAILRGSNLARAVLYPLGALLMTPTRSWRHSHNFHHANVGKVVGSSVGSFPILTTEMWNKASKRERLMYRISRNPLTLACAYLTVFFANVSLLPLIEEPRRYWDSAIALVLHASLITGVWLIGGPSVVFFALALPLLIASTLGAYIFYAQHNYEDVRILPAEEWHYSAAALESSSYMKLGPLMRYFTANIGYHHVHHLNPLIPFYRLPEAMAALPELQQPGITSLKPRDVLACLQLKLWDEGSQRIVTRRQARALERRARALALNAA